MTYVTFDKEIEVYNKLIESIRLDEFVDSNTILVNCSPEYSSILTQLANHKLSHLNSNELFYQIPLEMPFPVMSQVYNKETGEIEIFDKYLIRWGISKLYRTYKYLFLSSATLSGKSLRQVQLAVKTRLDSDNFRFAVAFHNEKSIFNPHYIGTTYEDTVTFQWENMNNPNKNGAK